MDVDKNILLNEKTAEKFADLIAKTLLPDVKILENLSVPDSKIKFDGDKWTWEIPKHN